MFSENDYELLNLINQNNREAEKKMLEKYNLLVWRNVNNLYNSYVPQGVEREDLYQEGCIALYHSFKTYDPDRQVPFFAFANLCIERSLIGYLRKFSSLTSKQFYNSVPLDAFVSEDVSLYFSDVLADDTEISALSKYDQDLGDVYLYESRIDDFEKNVLILQVAGYSYRETSEILNCSVKKVDNTMQKIKKTLN